MDSDHSLPVADPASSRRVDRRELFRWWGRPALAGLLLSAAGVALHGRQGRHRPLEAAQSEVPYDWRRTPSDIGRIATAGGAGPQQNLQRALAAMGGIEAFVRPGEKVALKPNCAWDRTPQQAANTDPDLVAEMARLCLAAGASSVVVVDNSCHDPDRAFERSGIGPAAREVGAKVTHQRKAAVTHVDLGGAALGEWDVLRPLLDADRVVNMPIVKHHSLSRATLGMKNWFGAIVGRRGRLHQRIGQVCAELGFAFRPTLTIVDATRILTAGGPTGGSLELVRPLDRIAVATDPVAADAWGASLLDLGPAELPHLEIAKRLGLGTVDWAAVSTEA